jgi:Putative polyhydroxyalkanoic acid system protein (PHA_gran_rgn)
MENGNCGAYMGLVVFPHADRSLSMPPPLIVSVPHRLGRDEATRRLKSGLETARTKLGQVFTIEEETWTDNRLQFRVRALGQAANGTVDVAEDHARLEVTLPWPLAQIADKVQRAVQSQGTAMLEKK